MQREEDCAQGQDPSHVKRHTATETKNHKHTATGSTASTRRRANDADKSADQRPLHQERLTDRILERTHLHTLYLQPYSDENSKTTRNRQNNRVRDQRWQNQKPQNKSRKYTGYWHRMTSHWTLIFLHILTALSVRQEARRKSSKLG